MLGIADKWLRQTKDANTYYNYGREIIRDWGRAYVESLPPDQAVSLLDIGCGWHVTDLLNIKNAVSTRPLALYGVDFYPPNIEKAEQRGVHVFRTNIECEPIPCEDARFDLVIANQTIEHTKEIFWIFSEISRVLKPGGRLIVGVPNLASLHNRLLLLLGRQPSAIEVLGPHVRGFTAPSFKRFIETDGYFKVLQVSGSNFYPFPPIISRPLSRWFPSLSVGLFLLVRREPKPGTFIHVLDTRSFETSYFRGSPA